MGGIRKIGNLVRAAESKIYFKIFALTHPNVVAGYNLDGGFRRVYHYHVRKTGGTSINHSFLSLGGEQSGDVYNRLVSSPRRQTVSGSKYFSGWDNGAIESGAYFYAFSHHTFENLNLPPRTFTLTCLRDPVDRVLSHYRMLVNYRAKGHSKPNHLYEGELDWAAGGFPEFLERIPEIHLCNQVHMFSECMDPNEAVANAATCDAILLTEHLDQGQKGLSRSLGLSLETHHIGGTSEIPVDVEDDDLARLRDRLSLEYRFLDALAEARPDFAGGAGG